MKDKIELTALDMLKMLRERGRETGEMYFKNFLTLSDRDQREVLYRAVMILMMDMHSLQEQMGEVMPTLQ